MVYVIWFYPFFFKKTLKRKENYNIFRLYVRVIVFIITAQKVIDTLQLENSSLVIYVMSFIYPLYKGELKKEMPMQIHQRQNLIVDEYDGEILEKQEHVVNVTRRSSRQIKSISR